MDFIKYEYGTIHWDVKKIESSFTLDNICDKVFYLKSENDVYILQHCIYSHDKNILKKFPNVNLKRYYFINFGVATFKKSLVLIHGEEPQPCMICFRIYSTYWMLCNKLNNYNRYNLCVDCVSNSTNRCYGPALSDFMTQNVLYFDTFKELGDKIIAFYFVKQRYDTVNYINLIVEPWYSKYNRNTPLCKVCLLNRVHMDHLYCKKCYDSSFEEFYTNSLIKWDYFKLFAKLDVICDDIIQIVYVLFLKLLGIKYSIVKPNNCLSVTSIPISSIVQDNVLPSSKIKTSSDDKLEYYNILDKIVNEEIVYSEISDDGEELINYEDSSDNFSFDEINNFVWK